LNMLQLSRRSSPAPVPTDLNRLAAMAVDTLRETALKEEKSITLELDTRLPPAECDPDQIYDVILNLALNAVQAVAPGKGQVTVQTQADLVPGMAAVRVTDNGPGVCDAQSIFEPFYTTKPLREGLGLGLSIARKIILQHGGRIEAQNLPGAGAVFVVTLPLQAATGADGAATVSNPT